MNGNSVKTIKLAKHFINKKDDSIHVLKDISIDIERGSFVSIMGPSGCGKSVLLKILGGILQPTSGTIILGDDCYDNGIPGSALKKIGFVFQKDNLQPWRSVEKNLMLPIEVFKLKHSMHPGRVDELLGTVGLLNYKKALPHELSGGMRQRVSLARALMHDPDIVLLDQPFGALDAITRKMLAYEFLAIWKKTKKTFFMVTNDVDEAILLSSKVYIMSKMPGEIENEIVIDIPYDIRNQQIITNNRYKELKSQITSLTSSLTLADERREANCEN